MPREYLLITRQVRLAPSAPQARRGQPLPCLNTNNCNEGSDSELHRLTAAHRRTAYALEQNCLLLIRRHGLNRMGFLTLTFARHVVSYKDAQKALHSFMTGVLRKRYQEYITVMERMESGRIHYHLLVTLQQDIRTGFDFEAVKKKDYRSASDYLRAEWNVLRKAAEKYDFGRTELLPIKKSAEGVARYVGKYIAKHIGQRKAEDKGARLVRYSKGSNRVSTNFTWVSPGADLWRHKLGSLCRLLGLQAASYSDTLKTWYGSNWIQTLTPLIESIRLHAYPSFWAMQKDYPQAIPPLEEMWFVPACNPFTGPWMNRHPDEANQTLLAAWMAALNEKERRVKRTKKRRQHPLADECELAPSMPPYPAKPFSWIEFSSKED